MKTNIALIAFILTAVFNSKEANAASFENCDVWLNDQTSFSVVADEALRFKNDGSLSKETKNRIKCIDCEPKIKNQVRIEFQETDKDMTNRYKQEVPERAPSEFNDVIMITKDEQGRVINVSVDSFTGGRGALIMGKKYTYYHDVTSYDFAYDEKGCFPSKVQGWQYAGKNKTEAEETFEIKKCQTFERLWSKIPSEKQVSYTRITNEPFHRTILPPPIELRRHLVESIRSLVKFTDEAQKDLDSLIGEKSSSEKVVQRWESFLYRPKNNCFGMVGDIRSGPTNEKWFLEARRSKPQENKPDSESTGRR